MKRTQIVNLLCDIKASFVSFFSILMFVALGVGIFVGISWTGPGIKSAVEGVFDNDRMYDIVIQFPYGLTEADLSQLASVEGVDEVERGRSAVQYIDVKGKKRLSKVLSRTEDIACFDSLEGELPTQPGQVALEKRWAEDNGIKLGDTINTAAGVNATAGLLKADSFVVTALVESPLYVAYASNTYGIGPTGSIECIIYADASTFDEEKYYSGYSDVYIRSDSLRPMDSFSNEYVDACDALVSRVKELGQTLGEQRYRSLSNSAKAQLNSGQMKIDSGKKALKEGKAKLDEGEQLIAQGEQELADGWQQYETLDRQARAKLADAKSKLDDGQAQYDKAKALLADAQDALDDVSTKYNATAKALERVERTCEKLVSTSVSNMAKVEAGTMSPQEYWDSVTPTYEQLQQGYGSLRQNAKSLQDSIGKLQKKVSGIGLKAALPTLGSIASLPSSVNDSNLVSREATMQSRIQAVMQGIEALKNSKISYLGEAAAFVEGASLIHQARGGLRDVKAELAKRKRQLDDAKEQYRAALTEYESKKESGLSKLESGQAELEMRKGELEEGKRQYKEKKSELEDASAELEEGKEKLAALKEFGWVVTPRKYNGGVLAVSQFSSITENLRYSMAALFVIVGLLVCYSAVSRLVHEQVTQIGTKKALGLRSREITLHFLVYSGAAVIVGALVGIAVGTFVVEGILSNAIGPRFITGPFPPYFSLPLAGAVTLLELVLILLASWLACRGILKKNAIELLRGEQPPKAKRRFFENWGVWQHMPLYTQTIVNNFFNDKRRVASTIIGVAGCTALIVTALTLNDNVLESFDREYDDILHYDTVATLSEDVKNQGADIVDVLAEKGFKAAVVSRGTYSVELPDGALNVATLTVPRDGDTFAEFITARTAEGGLVDLDASGVWVNNAYAEHFDAQAGDAVTLKDADGTVYQLPIAGVFEHHLPSYMVLTSESSFGELIGGQPPANMVFVDTNGAGAGGVDDALAGMDGYVNAVDEKAAASQDFASFSQVSRAVVAIYVVLSVLMAIVVLLNLNVMFIEEKKRDLIVLMINGYSVRDAKRYIYRDTIVLTVVGIVAGIFIGCVIGAFTVASIEPASASFIKSPDAFAIAVGAIGSALLAVVMSLVALRRIPRFNLTDINKM